MLVYISTYKYIFTLFCFAKEEKKTNFATNGIRTTVYSYLRKCTPFYMLHDKLTCHILYVT